MKKLLLITLTIFSVGYTVSAQESFKWAEMNNFHSTAMLSFHGAEGGKLQPTRDSAAAMLQKATVWQSAGVPAGTNEAAVKPLLNKLVAECKAIADAVASKKDDAALKPMVIKAHHTFHEIIEKSK